MPGRFAVGTALVAFGLVAGCYTSIDAIHKFDDYAANLCMAMFECDCQTYPDVETCTEDFARVVNAAELRALSEGLIRDEACEQARIEAALDNGCRSFSELAGSLETCQLYFGKREAGESCKSVDGGGRMSTCAQGLTCQGVCVQPGSGGAIVAEGEPCADASGRATTQCDPNAGLVCDYLGSGRCVIGVLDGEPCSPGVVNGCVGDAYCGMPGPGGPGDSSGTGDGGGDGGGGDGSDGMDTEGGPSVCVPRRNANQSCSDNNQCTTLHCENGRCQAASDAAICNLGVHF